MKVELYNKASGLIQQKQDIGTLKRNWDEDIFFVIETGKYEDDDLTKRQKIKIPIFNEELKDKIYKTIDEHYKQVVKEFEEL